MEKVSETMIEMWWNYQNLEHQFEFDIEGIEETGENKRDRWYGVNGSEKD